MTIFNKNSELHNSTYTKEYATSIGYVYKHLLRYETSVTQGQF